MPPRPSKMSWYGMSSYRMSSYRMYKMSWFFHCLLILLTVLAVAFLLACVGIRNQWHTATSSVAHTKPTIELLPVSEEQPLSNPVFAENEALIINPIYSEREKSSRRNKFEWKKMNGNEAFHKFIVGFHLDLPTETKRDKRREMTIGKEIKRGDGKSVREQPAPRVWQSFQEKRLEEKPTNKPPDFVDAKNYFSKQEDVQGNFGSVQKTQENQPALSIAKGTSDNLVIQEAEPRYHVNIRVDQKHQEKKGSDRLLEFVRSFGLKFFDIFGRQSEKSFEKKNTKKDDQRHTCNKTESENGLLENDAKTDDDKEHENPIHSFIFVHNGVEKHVNSKHQRKKRRIERVIRDRNVNERQSVRRIDDNSVNKFRHIDRTELSSDILREQNAKSITKEKIFISKQRRAKRSEETSQTRLLKDTKEQEEKMIHREEQTAADATNQKDKQKSKKASDLASADMQTDKQKRKVSHDDEKETEKARKNYEHWKLMTEEDVEEAEHRMNDDVDEEEIEEGEEEEDVGDDRKRRHRPRRFYVNVDDNDQESDDRYRRHFYYDDDDDFEIYNYDQASRGRRYYFDQEDHRRRRHHYGDNEDDDEDLVADDRETDDFRRKHHQGKHAKINDNAYFDDENDEGDQGDDDLKHKETNHNKVDDAGLKRAASNPSAASADAKKPAEKEQTLLSEKDKMSKTRDETMENKDRVVLASVENSEKSENLVTDENMEEKNKNLKTKVKAEKHAVKSRHMTRSNDQQTDVKRDENVKMAENVQSSDRKNRAVQEREQQFDSYAYDRRVRRRVHNGRSGKQSKTDLESSAVNKDLSERLQKRRHLFVPGLTEKRI